MDRYPNPDANRLHPANIRHLLSRRHPGGQAGNAGHHSVSAAWCGGSASIRGIRRGFGRPDDAQRRIPAWVLLHGTADVGYGKTHGHKGLGPGAEYAAGAPGLLRVWHRLVHGGLSGGRREYQSDDRPGLVRDSVPTLRPP